MFLKKLSIFLFVFILMFSINSIMIKAQDNSDDEYYDDDEYYEDEPIDWKYIFFDLSYGGSGPGFGLGFRYWNLGASIGVTGFANDIPLTTHRYQGDNFNIKDFPKKVYPSNLVSGDFYGFYDMEKFTAYVNLGFYSSVDSVLRFRESNTGYYKDGVEKHSGITWGFGVDYPLSGLDEENKAYEQLVVGLGFHSELGVYLKASYRWE